MSAPTQADAARLAALGVKVHWCGPATTGQRTTGKRPLGAAWQAQGYSAEPAPPPVQGANLGIQTGRVDGATLELVCVDFDNAAALEWARAGGVPPTPMRTVTGSGEHWYYRYPGRKVPNKCRFTLADGTKLAIDIRGDGGNVIVAPSVHYTGAVYREAEDWAAIVPTTLPFYDPAWLDGRRNSASMGRPAATGYYAQIADEPALPETSDQPPSERTGVHGEEFTRRLYECLSRGAGGKEAIAAVRAIERGEVYAPEGERNNTLFQAVRLLAEWFPDATDAQLVEFCTPSVLKSGSRTEDEELALLHDHVRRSRAHFAERDNLLTALFSSAAQVTPTTALVEHGADLRSRLLLTFPSGGHVLMARDGSYNAVMWRGNDLANHVQHPDMLGWAESGGLAQFTFTDEKGRRQRVSWRTILERHSYPVQHWRGDFDTAYSYLDGNTFVEAVAPRRNDLTPRADEHIDTWLRALGGNRAELLLDWLATFPQLSRPTPALVLVGARATGKNLLVDGLARLWKHGTPVPFDSTLQSFNEALQRCPLLFADEKLPSAPRERGQLSEHLRALVTARQHELNRKYQPVVTIHGCVRIVVAMNDSRIEFGETMNHESKQALAERLLHVEVGAHARDVLAELRGAGVDLGAWVSGDGIIRHVLHLAEQRTVKPGTRLLVEGNGESLINDASNTRGVSADVCCWLTGHLMNPSALSGPAKDFVRAGDGELWVCAEAWAGNKAAWELFVQHGDGKLPTANALGRALSNLSGDRTRKLALGGKRGGEKRTFHAVDVKALVAWAERAGIGEREAMLAAIDTPRKVPSNVVADAPAHAVAETFAVAMTEAPAPAVVQASVEVAVRSIEDALCITPESQVRMIERIRADIAAAPPDAPAASDNPLLAMLAAAPSAITAKALELTGKFWRALDAEQAQGDAPAPRVFEAPPEMTETELPGALALRSVADTALVPDQSEARAEAATETLTAKPKRARKAKAPGEKPVKAPKAAKAPKPPKLVPVRGDEYYTPTQEHAVFSELRGQLPSSLEQAIAVFAPHLRAAQAGHPGTFARLTAAYRAYLGAVRGGTGALEPALDAWFDRVQPPFVATSMTSKVSA